MVTQYRQAHVWRRLHPKVWIPLKDIKVLWVYISQCFWSTCKILVWSWNISLNFPSFFCSRTKWQHNLSFTLFWASQLKNKLFLTTLLTSACACDHGEKFPEADLALFRLWSITTTCINYLTSGCQKVPSVKEVDRFLHNIPDKLLDTSSFIYLFISSLHITSKRFGFAVVITLAEKLNRFLAERKKLHCIKSWHWYDSQWGNEAIHSHECAEADGIYQFQLHSWYVYNLLLLCKWKEKSESPCFCFSFSFFSSKTICFFEFFSPLNDQ